MIKVSSVFFSKKLCFFFFNFISSFLSLSSSSLSLSPSTTSSSDRRGPPRVSNSRQQPAAISRRWQRKKEIEGWGRWKKERHRMKRTKKNPIPLFIFQRAICHFEKKRRKFHRVGKHRPSFEIRSFLSFFLDRDKGERYFWNILQNKKEKRKSTLFLRSPNYRISFFWPSQDPRGPNELKCITLLDTANVPNFWLKWNKVNTTKCKRKNGILNELTLSHLKETWPLLITCIWNGFLAFFLWCLSVSWKDMLEFSCLFLEWQH